MKDVLMKVKGAVGDVTDLMMNLVALAVLVEVIYGSGIFGMGVVGNITSIVNSLGQSGFAGLLALLVLVGLFRKKE
jgi:hypothetical protein